MAKVKSSGLRNYVGRLAGSVYYMDKGRNISREVAAQVSNPKTQGQMVQRVRLANLVNFYRANKEWMLKYAFEKLIGLQSVYNTFVSLNLTPQAVPLTKENAAAGVVMPDLVKVTKGSLPVVPQSIAPKTTEMYLTGFEVTPESATIAELSAELIKIGWKEGDQLSIIAVNYQSVRPCLVTYKEIILSTKDNTPLSNYGIYADQDGYVTIDLKTNDTEYTIGHGGVFIHSRRVNGQVLVSSQILNLDDRAMQACFAARSTRAYELAIASYGYQDPAFLDPDTGNDALQGVRINAVTEDVNAGSVTGAGYYEPGTQVTLTATPKPKFEFYGWFKDNNIPFASTTTITITANADINLTARFKEKIQQGGDGGITSGSGVTE